MLDAMWAANTLDIQHTVKAVCQEVLLLCSILLPRGGNASRGSTVAVCTWPCTLC